MEKIYEYRIEHNRDESVYILLYSQPNVPKDNYSYRFPAVRLDSDLFKISTLLGPFAPVIILDEKEDKVYIEYKGNVLEEFPRTGQSIMDAFLLIQTNTIDINPYYPGDFIAKINGERLRFGMETTYGNFTCAISELFVSSKCLTKRGILTPFLEFELMQSKQHGDVINTHLTIKDLAHNIMNKKYGEVLNFTLRPWVVMRCGKRGYTFILKTSL